MSHNRKLRAEVPGEKEEVDRLFAPTGCRAVDALFRKKGYRIWSRVGSDEAIWEKRGVLYPESELIIRMDETELADARHLEDLYRESIR